MTSPSILDLAGSITVIDEGRTVVVAIGFDHAVSAGRQAAAEGRTFF
jgi:hypothetical protein